MPQRARRLPLRWLNGSARRALLAVCGLMAGLAPATAEAPQDAAADIVAARYVEPTARYPHGVLGDDLEWGALLLTLDRCPACARADRQDIVIRLPQTRVFEDFAPRVLDLDFDGLREVVVIESDAARGARLAIYGPNGLIAATPHIGRPFRWLAPLGAADLDGDGAMDLAYIDRPHLAKTLRVWRYADRQLTQVAALAGLTNHRIGEAFISGGIRDCGQGPEIVTADAGWQQVMATRLHGTTLTTRPIGVFTGAASLKSALTCNN